MECTQLCVHLQQLHNMLFQIHTSINSKIHVVQSDTPHMACQIDCMFVIYCFQNLFKQYVYVLLCVH